MPKALMDTMSSRLEAAISNVLTPFSSPYPKRLSRNRLGTSTAGLTADNVNLWNDNEWLSWMWVVTRLRIYKIIAWIGKTKTFLRSIHTSFVMFSNRKRSGKEKSKWYRVLGPDLKISTSGKNKKIRGFRKITKIFITILLYYYLLYLFYENPVSYFIL